MPEYDPTEGALESVHHVYHHFHHDEEPGEPKRFVTLEYFESVVSELREEMIQMGTSQQDQIDAITAEVTAQNATISQVAADAAAAQQKLQAEVDNLAAQVAAGQPVSQASIDALKVAVDAGVTATAPLDGVVTALGNTVPTPPPAPAPAPAEPAPPAAEPVPPVEPPPAAPVV